MLATPAKATMTLWQLRPTMDLLKVGIDAIIKAVRAADVFKASISCEVRSTGWARVGERWTRHLMARLKRKAPMSRMRLSIWSRVELVLLVLLVLALMMSNDVCKMKKGPNG